jgi:anti-sigma factor RsiW
MTCERCKAEIEDLLYGELSDARATEIRAHLASCSACALEREALERENEIFSTYYEQTALEPSAEMWEAIRSRINFEPAMQEQGRSSDGFWASLMSAGAVGWLLRPSLLRQTAFALALIALSVAATTLFLKRSSERRDVTDVTFTTPTLQPTVPPAPSPSPTVAPVEVPPPPVRTTPSKKPVQPVKQLTDQEMLNQQIARAEREYQNAIKMLDRAIVKRKDSFDSELIKQYESSLALIDDSIATSRRALRTRPNDLAAGQFLLAAYARKVELMQDIAMR